MENTQNAVITKKKKSCYQTIFMSLDKNYPATFIKGQYVIKNITDIEQVS